MRQLASLLVRRQSDDTEYANLQVRGHDPVGCLVCERFGELTELRRRDLVLDPDQGKGVIRIERAVVRTDGGSRPRRPRATPGLVMSPSRRT